MLEERSLFPPLAIPCVMLLNFSWQAMPEPTFSVSLQKHLARDKWGALKPKQDCSLEGFALCQAAVTNTKPQMTTSSSDMTQCMDEKRIFPTFAFLGKRTISLSYSVLSAEGSQSTSNNLIRKAEFCFKLEHLLKTDTE